MLELKEMLKPLADVYRYLVLSCLAGRKLRMLAELCNDPLCIIELTFSFSYKHSLLPPVSIRDADLRARRPRDSSLDTEKAQSLGISIPSVDKCLEDFIERYIQKR